MQTKRLGNIGEAKTLWKFVSLNVPVYIPFGDNEKSDLIAEFGGKLNKIQVKTSETLSDGKFEVSLKSSTVHNGMCYYYTYSSGDIDYFAIYNLETDILMLVPIIELENRTAVKISVPWVPSRNQYKSLNWEDYTFEKIISSAETLHDTSLNKDEEKVQTTTEQPGHSNME
jgi:hypothetical protein